MAIIKNFQEEREARQRDSGVDYRERIRAHKLKVFIRSFVALVLIVVAIVIINKLWNDKEYTEIVTIESFPVSVVSGTGLKDLGGSVLLYSKDGASCIDSKGKAVWNRSYEMQSPLVSVCNQTVAIGDYNGREIYVANKDSLLGTIRTNLPIRALSVSNNGVVAAVLDDSDVIRIYVYDGNNDTDEPIVKAKATMAKSGYPVSVSLSPNGKLMMVSYFYVDSGNMKSSVSFYNFGEVGSNKTDNFVSGFDYVGAVMPYVQFLGNDAAFGVSNDRVVFFSGNEIPDNVGTAMLNEKVLGVYYGAEHVGLVFPDSSGEATYRLDTFSSSGSKLSSIKLDSEFTDVVYTKDSVIVYNDKECHVYTVKGYQKFSGTFDESVNMLIPTSTEYRYLLIGTDSMEMVGLN